MSGINARTAADLERYEQAWTRTMLNIWTDRLRLLTTERTGRLRRSLVGTMSTKAGMEASWQFRFLRYGIYVDHGRRTKDGTGSTRRPWFTPSWRISRRVLTNALIRFIGEAYKGAIAKMQ